MTSSATTGAAALPALDGTMGMLLVGTLLAAALFGVTCTQTFTYYQNYPQDRWPLKCLVAAAFVLDLAHQVLISHSIYYYLITHFANPAQLMVITPTIILEIEVTAISACIVQGFFIWRIWHLSKRNLFVVVPAILCALAGMVVSTVYVCRAFGLSSFAALPEIETESILINVFGVLTDITIAVAMIHLLLAARTGIVQSGNIIRRLMVFVVTTGLLTSMCAVASMIAVLAAPDKFIHICFYFTLGRLYANSLIASLNARASMRDDLQSDTGNTLSWNVASNAGAESRPYTITGMFKSTDTNTSTNPTDPTLDDSFEGNHEPNTTKLNDLTLKRDDYST